MAISAARSNQALATNIRCSAESLTAELVDGRTVSVPLAWHPRLVHATPKERDNWNLEGDGDAIRWPDLDEDILIEGLLVGRRSGESKRSFNRWLRAKKEGRGLTIPELDAHEKAENQRLASND